MNILYIINLLLIIFLDILSGVLLMTILAYRKYVRETFIVNANTVVFGLLYIMTTIVLSVLFFFPKGWW